MLSSAARTSALLLTGILLATGVGLAPALAPTPAAAAPDTGGLDLEGDDAALLSAQTQAIAPGLNLTSFSRQQPNGWVTGHVLVADLSTPTLSLDVLDSGTVSGGATVTDQIAGTGAVAAVNGDYFDINASGAPVGTNVSSEGIETVAASPRNTLTIADGIAAVQQLDSTATVAFAASSHPVDVVNAPSLPNGSIGWYTAAWGDHPLERPLGGPGPLPQRITRVDVTAGVVTAVTTDPASVTGATSITDGSGVLLGRGAGADVLATLVVGDTVDVAVSLTADVDLAVGGSERLLVDGAPAETGAVDASRTAVGISRDGTTIFVVSIEGRQADAKGMTITELGELLLDLGAWNAVNLDGGGSSALLAREQGTTEAQLVNRPSDGTERVVANSLAFFSSAEPGVLENVRVDTALGSEHATAVFPGLRRTLTGVGLDSSGGGIPTTGTFTGRGVAVQSTDGASAVITGVEPGAASVQFSAAGRSATLPLRVLGDLARIRPSATVVPLPDPGSSAVVRLSGMDADGFSAPLEVADVQVQAGPDVRVTPNGLDSYLIEPAVDSGAATVTFSAGGQSVDVAVTVGYRTQVVADFADGAAWAWRGDRATGALAPVTGPHGEPALQLTHDFTTSTGTRGSYAVFPEAIPGGATGRVIEGQPQALTLWVNGDGNGSWPRIQARTGAGVTVNLDGPNVTWTGWQQVRFTVPPGTAYPLTVQRLRFMETRASVSYQGQLQVSTLEAIVPPDVMQPEQARVFDPFVVTNGTVDDRPQRIAVMSDSQFVGRNPDSEIVAAARRTLREIVAAEPDLLVINGDFVDEAATIDFALAKRILDEEIGDALPYVYVPGNHEVMGGPISNFTSVFGDTRRVIRVGGTVLITLNTANGSYRASDSTQLRWFEQQLDDAAGDGGVTGVIVFSHHPADDPLPNKASQLSDRIEAAAFLERLSAFRADTGKSIAVINAHVGVFHATSTDGVSRFISGNSGKSPSSTPDNGGFTGWTMLGVDPGEGVVGSEPVTVSDRIQWMRAETHARADAVELTAPTVLEVGELVGVSATVNQDGSRIVPVQWPLSAQWGGTGVVVDDGSAALERAASIVRLNPATGQLLATAPGTARLTVTVNGVSDFVDVVVAGDDTEPGGGDGGSGQEDGARGDDLASTGLDGSTLSALMLLAGLALLAGLGALLHARRSRRI